MCFGGIDLFLRTSVGVICAGMQELPYIYMSGKAKAQHLMWFAEKHASYKYVLAQSYIYIYALIKYVGKYRSCMVSKWPIHPARIVDVYCYTCMYVLSYTATPCPRTRT